jgi:hypothetical protein
MKERRIVYFVRLSVMAMYRPFSPNPIGHACGSAHGVLSGAIGYPYFIAVASIGSAGDHPHANRQETAVQFYESDFLVAVRLGSGVCVPLL